MTQNFYLQRKQEKKCYDSINMHQQRNSPNFKPTISLKCSTRPVAGLSAEEGLFLSPPSTSGRLLFAHWEYHDPVGKK